MNVSRQFLKDFAFLANYYGWTPADIEQVKADTRANPDLLRYWTVLANAHRAGYEQTRENGHIRLQAWCQQEGRPDPFYGLQARGLVRRERSESLITQEV